MGSALERVCLEKQLNFIGLNHSELDICNYSGLKSRIEQIKPRIIINTASMLGINACEENPQKAFEVNATGPFYLANICNKNEIILVQTSTNALFDGTKEDFYFETDKPNPRNMYGLSKYCGEKVVENNLLAHYIVRFAKLFGSRRNNTLGFTDKMIQKMRKREELRIADDRFDPFTYNIHAARKVLDILEQRYPFGIYHVASKGSVSYFDFACRFAKEIGYEGSIIRIKDKDFPSQYVNPLRTELSSKKVLDMPTWEEGLEEYLKQENVKIG
jgi:dTDP-4-dehydrorhamnose reductase